MRHPIEPKIDLHFSGPSTPPGSVYDQGFFNAACKLVDEIVPRNYLHFLVELDASGMDRMRNLAKRENRMPPTYTAFVIKAVSTALLEHPHLNCMIQETPFEKRLVRLQEIIATVAVERIHEGLDMVFAAQLEDSARRSLTSLTRQLRSFAQVDINALPEYRRFHALIKWARWLPTLVGWLFRLPSLSPKFWRAYRGGSFAVTSPAKYGGCDQVLPPWPWPLTFSFGQVKERPWVLAGRVVVRKTMRLTVTADRRLANGAPLARFSERVRGLLENPEEMEPTQQRTAREPERLFLPH